MLVRILSKYPGSIAAGAGLLSASIYAVMTNITLAHIEAVSGLPAFDMRPAGYGPSEAATLLEALGVEGRSYYLSHQIALDTLYPALLTLTLIATIFWLGQHLSGRRLVLTGMVLSIGGGLFDYAENIGIVAMIWSWPDVSTLLVHATSVATIAKSTLTTLAVLMMLIIGLARAVQLLKAARRA